jgi:ribonuclease HI
VILGEDAVIAEQYGAEQYTTNNRMEMIAAINALEKAVGLGVFSSADEITVFTDSQYVQKGVKEWVSAWKKRGWLTADKKPVKNKDLWQKLDALAARLPLKWQWVKGHAGDVYNERCDKMTQEAIQSVENQ